MAGSTCGLKVAGREFRKERLQAFLMFWKGSGGSGDKKMNWGRCFKEKSKTISVNTVDSKNYDFFQFINILG
jgi:hypothetical protein